MKYLQKNFQWETCIKIKKKLYTREGDGKDNSNKMYGLHTYHILFNKCITNVLIIGGISLNQNF